MNNGKLADILRYKMKAYKKIIRKYYKNIEVSWTQPVLSANGTLGGDAFAVASDSYISSNYAWHAFAGSYWQSSTSGSVHWFTMYNPEPIKLQELRWYNNAGSNYHITSGYLQASNDNSSWTNIGTVVSDTTSQALRTVTVDTPDYYKYYRLYITGWTGTTAFMASIAMIAVVPSVTEGTEEDYDFYIDKVQPCVVDEGIVRKYYKYVDVAWTQPSLTSNGTIGGDRFAVTAKSERSSYPAYSAINDNGYWVGTGGSTSSSTFYEFYNPEPLKVTQVTWNNAGNWYNFTGGTFEGSTDGITWQTLGNIDSDNGTTSLRVIDISQPNYYKYYRWDVTSISRSSYNQTSDGQMSNIKIYATQEAVAEGSSEDYDFYEDVQIYKAVKSYERGQYYGN